MDLLQLTAEAKERLTIPDIWRRLALPGEPRDHGVCKSPFREDRSGASFSIFKQGRMFKDHAEGDAQQGDAVCFLQVATGCDRAQAMRTLIEMAGMGHMLERGKGAEGSGQRVPLKVETRAVVPDRGTGWGFRPLPEMPEGLEVTAERIEALARQRGLADWAVLAATEQGLLCFVRKWGRDCWMVRDSTGCNAQVRRLDGEPWSVNGQSLKGMTLPGSWASWPLGCGGSGQGAEVSGQKHGILLVEGAPDLLAAVQWLEETEQADAFIPVAMLGAGQPIQGSALCHFVGKDVRIMEQRDPAKTRRDGTTYFPGQDAARKWLQQLAPVAASCRIIHLPDAMPGKDLNDYLKWNQRTPLPALT